MCTISNVSDVTRRHSSMSILSIYFGEIFTRVRYFFCVTISVGFFQSRLHLISFVRIFNLDLVSVIVFYSSAFRLMVFLLCVNNTSLH